MNESFEEINCESDDYHRAGLLVALLLHYPELDSVRVHPAEETLTLSFFLREPLEYKAYQEMVDEVDHNLRLLSYIEGRRTPRTIHIRQRKEASLPIIDIHRDIHTLTADEFPVLFDCLKKHLARFLFAEDIVPSAHLLGYDNEVSISQALDSTKMAQPQAVLVGVRDAERVLVFSSR